jgi:thioredoxin reductase/pSer/pThr/pTyr-binding forkhead associated (FHA) protein/ferredoxin
MAERESDDYTRRGALKIEGGDPLPDVLDILVAGGGPAGAAAAVRAKELELSCLVIDYDDLLKRIRDYPKEKLIKPSYGGGDKLPFPTGGPLLASLYFDDIDKDDMVAAWKRKLRDHGVHAKIGTELTGLARTDDELWEVRAWSHRAGEEVRYRARNVLIAIGAGVPRRFDIPGNSDGITFRLDDAQDYVGAPTLVIGGGTSAAEAVIAISNAKTAAGDATQVYWSYRGNSMPKVSKALNEVFFNAYVGNGNIHYLPFSEPTAVVTATDKCEYLSVRVDRKVVEGRPAETLHLEFPKSHVVACIGEDLPVRFLSGLGITIPVVNKRALMLVSHEGEVSQPGVFLVGDARGPKYLRCTRFDDAATYEQITEKRNIKAAMNDAVAVVEVIATRAGRTVAKAAPPAGAAAPGRPIVPPTPTEAADARAPAVAARLVSLQGEDTAEEEFPLTRATTVIGRKAADIACPDDVYMTDRHALLTARGDDVVLEDCSGGSGVWLAAHGTTGRPVGEGDLVWVGEQILMGAPADGGWGVAHYDTDAVYQATYPVGPKGLFVGRASEAKLDPADASLSRRHAQFRVDADGLKVYDLGSRNGTFVKITAPVALAPGDEFRVASRRFRFERFAAVAKLAASDIVVAAPASAPPAPAPAGEIAAGAHPVEIQHAEHPVQFWVAPGQDMLHAYFDHLRARFPGCKTAAGGEPTEHVDEPLGWECKVGLCGLCAVEIVAGAENLEPPDPGSPEMNTIENKAFLEPDPARNRLTCLARVKGPVTVTIPS